MDELMSELVGRVQLLTFSRAESLNAFNNALYRLLADALQKASDDPAVAAVVITGKGRAFSAGQDMSEMAAIGEDVSGPGESSGAGAEAAFPILLDVLEVFDKPLIAAVNGLGVGLGFTILAHSDLVVMADDARLRAPFCPLGVAPEAASSVLFPDRMGWQRAAWVLLSGEWVDAQQALEMGIAWKVLPKDQVLPAALDAAATIARWPIPSLVATKRAMLAGRADRVRAARQTEDDAFRTLIGSPGNIEAVTAFLERRDPDFSAIEGA